ncbi:GNAT family N-acetyltransferase [Jatrophihabitans sp. YIM 134969]
MPVAVDPRWLGRRVVLRRPLRDADGGDAHLADALGDLVGLDPVHAVVETAAGRTEVDLEAVVAARLVEPSTPDVLALELTTARGWQAEEVEESVDGWLLRADHGVTGRANTALALRTPKRPLAEAVADTRAWYAERGLPLGITVPLPARSLLDGGLEEYCGLTADIADDVHVLVARVDTLLAAAPAPTAVVALSNDPDDRWFAVHRGGATAGDPVMQAILKRHDRVAFASVLSGDDVVAIGRAVVDDAPVGRDGRPGTRWLGITGLDVAPDVRGRGLARTVLRSLWEWGAEQGATRSYLQVASGNQPAIRLYLSSGYWHHHDYRYRHDPTPLGR